MAGVTSLLAQPGCRAQGCASPFSKWLHALFCSSLPSLPSKNLCLQQRSLM